MTSARPVRAGLLAASRKVPAAGNAPARPGMRPAGRTSATGAASTTKPCAEVCPAANVDGKLEGLAKVIFDTATRELPGAQAFGARSPS